MDLLRFMFYILDPQRIGLIEKVRSLPFFLKCYFIFMYTSFQHELKHFFYAIWRHRPYGSLDEAMSFLERFDDDGSYTFPEIAALRTTYPNIFYPVYQLQQQIIAHSLGEDWWTEHKAILLDELNRKKEIEAKMLQKQKKEKERALETVSDDMIRKKMGIRYYIMPWTIERERKRLVKIAAIEQDLERQFAEIKRDGS